MVGHCKNRRMLQARSDAGMDGRCRDGRTLEQTGGIFWQVNIFFALPFYYFMSMVLIVFVLIVYICLLNLLCILVWSNKKISPVSQLTILSCWNNNLFLILYFCTLCCKDVEGSKLKIKILKVIWSVYSSWQDSSINEPMKANSINCWTCWVITEIHWKSLKWLTLWGHQTW